MRKHDAVVGELAKWCEEQGNCYVERETILPQVNPTAWKPESFS